MKIIVAADPAGVAVAAADIVTDVVRTEPAAVLGLATGSSPLGLYAELAARVAAGLKANFLNPGGLVTTLSKTGQQWDAPNGWAPLQYLAIEGLARYGQQPLADTVARRWLRLNSRVFQQTGKMLEKYDVVNLSRPAGGGEYPLQDGFGWTNGVLLRLLNRYRVE